MLVSLTVGKVDAGVAVLLTEDKRLVSVQHPLLILLFILEGMVAHKHEQHIFHTSRTGRADRTSLIDRIPFHPPPA